MNAMRRRIHLPAIVVVIVILVVAGVGVYFALKSEEGAGNGATPAEFKVSNLVFNPSEVEVGNPVTISATVKNVGDLEGTYAVELKIDGVIETTQNVTLAGGATENVSFTVTKDASGTYAIRVNELQCALSVLEPYYENEPLQYRELDSFTTEGCEDVRHHAAMRGYDLPDEIVEWPDFALYVVVQNLDDVPGTFEVCYTLSTADKNAAEKQQWLVQRTLEEYAELDIEYYEGSIELYLESGEVGVAICPLDGIYVAPDRVPFSHEHKVIPNTKTIEKERTVTR